MSQVISVNSLDKVYESGFKALANINLEIDKGEIFALLGPNGAGKTTLISIICGIVNSSSGTVSVDGHDIKSSFRQARSQIGLVPQELALSIFETVWATVRFSRGLYGKTPDDSYLEDLLKKLSLWDKKDSKIVALSGGMKRRVLIAKALAHQPKILFLDEPTAGVDVELRQDMWEIIRTLADDGVTIVLTTHYIEEAEEMADRIGIILKGEIILVDRKTALMERLGKKQLFLHLTEPLDTLPVELENENISLSQDKTQLMYEFDAKNEDNKISSFLKKLYELGFDYKDLHTKQSSLEDIFVDLVGGSK